MKESITISLHAGSEELEAYIASHDEAALILLDIPRKDVEAGRPGELVDRLMVLSETKANVLRFANSLTLQFSGYDEDPRELYEIQEAVAYFRKVTEMWPHWWHFGEKFGDTLAVVLRQLIDGSKVTDGTGRVGYQMHDPSEPNRTIMRLFDAMNVMYRHFGISDEENRKMSNRVVATLAPFLRA